MKRTWLGFFSLLLVVVGAACSNAEEKVNEALKEADEASEQLAEQTEDLEGDVEDLAEGLESGEASVGNELPAGWPEDFPVPEGATLDTAYDTGNGLTAEYETTAGLSEVLAFYEQELATNGWEVGKVEGGTDQGGVTTINFSGNGFTGTVNLTLDEEAGGSILIKLIPDGEAG